MRMVYHEKRFCKITLEINSNNFYRLYTFNGSIEWRIRNISKEKEEYMEER